MLEGKQDRISLRLQRHALRELDDAPHTLLLLLDARVVQDGGHVDVVVLGLHVDVHDGVIRGATTAHSHVRLVRKRGQNRSDCVFQLLQLHHPRLESSPTNRHVSDFTIRVIKTTKKKKMSSNPFGVVESEKPKNPFDAVAALVAPFEDYDMLDDVPHLPTTTTTTSTSTDDEKPPKLEPIPVPVPVPVPVAEAVVSASTSTTKTTTKTTSLTLPKIKPPRQISPLEKKRLIQAVAQLDKMAHMCGYQEDDYKQKQHLADVQLRRCMHRGETEKGKKFAVAALRNKKLADQSSNMRMNIERTVESIRSITIISDYSSQLAVVANTLAVVMRNISSEKIAASIQTMDELTAACERVADEVSKASFTSAGVDANDDEVIAYYNQVAEEAGLDLGNRLQNTPKSVPRIEDKNVKTTTVGTTTKKKKTTTTS